MFYKSKALNTALGVTLIVLTSCAVKYNTPLTYIQEKGGVTFEKVSGDDFFEYTYLLWFEQPIDHNNPETGTFMQRVWLSHTSAEAPVVLITEGYNAPKPYKSELAELLEANQLIVEHRFYGESGTDSVLWDYLTIKQAAQDLHNIVKYFSKLYRSPWVSTGISKGGTTAIIHRAFYPLDVDLTVSYVAPLNEAREDERLISFFDNVDSEEIRAQIRDFQIEVLRNRDSIYPLFASWARDNGVAFAMGAEAAFELVVLEYPFSFWQWCVPPTALPGKEATVQELYDALYQGVDFRYFSEQEGGRMAPYFYQAYTQLGHYAYNAFYLKQYLKYYSSDIVSSDILAPDTGGELFFDMSAMEEVRRRLKRYDPPMIHLVGALDPWSATMADITGLSRNHVFIDSEGCHLTRIGNIPQAMRDLLMDTMDLYLQRARLYKVDPGL